MNINLRVQNENLVRSLQTRLDETLGSLLSSGVQVAHVGYPNHWNTGDPAIWLGTEATLGRLGISIVYQCDYENYQREAVARSIGSGPILIAGGGNLGDLYADHQSFREQILLDFPDNFVLQLPQSVWFKQPRNLLRFQSICDRHPNFHILLRDRRSLHRATQHFSVPVSLCPDMAFGLGSLERPAQASTDVVWLSRTDEESSWQRKSLEALGIEPQDWISPGPNDQNYIVRAGKYNNRIKELVRQLTRHATVGDATSTELAECYHQLAQLRVGRGLQMLSTGRVVITDRLHGHILCLLMGIPHVVLDNNYKKVSSVFMDWTSASPIATWAQSPQQAVQAALAIINGLNSV